MTNMTPEQAALVREAQSFGLQPRHIGGSYVLLSGVCRSFEELGRDIARIRRARARRLAMSA